MLTNKEKSRLLFQTIGSPIGSGTAAPQGEVLEELTDFAFKSRVGLLFLDECLRLGAHLGPKALELHQSLSTRRLATNEVVVKLAKSLDSVAAGEWVLFKSIKPFASTPNDTDWFPLDRERHAELCRHLIESGEFKWLETAPRQTTLIESGGEGITDTTKRGGVYYIDCYVIPSTDYFIYLDSRRLRTHVGKALVNGYPVPILAPHAELVAIMFHNVFPERSFSTESYYLIKRYIDSIDSDGTMRRFIDVCRDQKTEFAAAANLAAVRDIDQAQFGQVDTRVAELLSLLGYPKLELRGFDAAGSFPYEFSNRVFWQAFLSKQRDRTSFVSTLNQAIHMLNPIFFADVIKILWRRCFRGGVYGQN